MLHQSTRLNGFSGAVQIRSFSLIYCNTTFSGFGEEFGISKIVNIIVSVFSESDSTIQ